MNESTLAVFKAALKEHVLKLVMLAAIFGFITFMVAVIQPREYRSAGRLLIVPKDTANFDAYTASQAGQRLGSILKEVVYSNSFLNEVLASGNVVNDYGRSARQKMKLWKHRVQVSIEETSGILTLEVYDVSAAQAQLTAQTIFALLESNGARYYGGKGVDIRQVDTPTVSQHPVRPRLLLATAGGLAAGFVVGGGLIFILSPEMAARKRELVFDPHEEYRPDRLSQ